MAVMTELRLSAGDLTGLSDVGYIGYKCIHGWLAVTVTAVTVRFLPSSVPSTLWLHRVIFDLAMVQMPRYIFDCLDSNCFCSWSTVLSSMDDDDDDEFIDPF